MSSARLIDSTRVGTIDVTHDPEFPLYYVLGIVLLGFCGCDFLVRVIVLGKSLADRVQPFPEHPRGSRENHFSKIKLSTRKCVLRTLRPPRPPHGKLSMRRKKRGKGKNERKKRKVELVVEDGLIVWISQSGYPLSAPAHQCHPGSLDAKGSTACMHVRRTRVNKDAARLWCCPK